MKLLYWVVDPIEILPIKRNHIYRKNKLNFHKSKIFSLKTSDSSWNDDFINRVNKLRKSDVDVEAGLIDQTIVIFNRYDNLLQHLHQLSISDIHQAYNYFYLYLFQFEQYFQN